MRTWAFLFVIVSFFALPLRAQESPSIEGERVEEPAPLPMAGKVVPVAEGEAAPFTGLLVPEKRFTELLEAEMTNAELRRKMEVQERLAKSVETMFEQKLKEATRPIPWYDSPSFNRWLGIGLGVVVTALAVYGGSRLAEVGSNGGTHP